MDNIYIKNEDSQYCKWVVTEVLENNCFHISLSSDRSIISTINELKIYEKDNKYYSDWIKPTQEKFDFAFTPFKLIKLD